MLLESLCQRDRGLNVLLLRRFVAASQQDNDNASSLRVIDPISWPEIDLQLADTVSQNPMLPRIPVNESIDANLNSCTTCSVIQQINPIQINLGSFNTHDSIVSHGIHGRKADRL
ncbi:hypothetical protein GALL_496480 [mine drainage metagenome]|uniref:Uncharacterized protein n=1 Tax=mine drainage metagenome TaxID=410659 RepID=A0A1J5PMD3_9ZZZZ